MKGETSTLSNVISTNSVSEFKPISEVSFKDHEMTGKIFNQYDSITSYENIPDVKTRLQVQTKAVNNNLMKVFSNSFN